LQQRRRVPGCPEPISGLTGARFRSLVNPDAARPGSHIHDGAASAAYLGHELVLGDRALRGHWPLHRHAPGNRGARAARSPPWRSAHCHASRAGVRPDVARASLLNMHDSDPVSPTNSAVDAGCACSSRCRCEHPRRLRYHPAPCPEPVCARTSSLIFEMVTEPEPVSACHWTMDTLHVDVPGTGVGANSRVLAGPVNA